MEPRNHKKTHRTAKTAFAVLCASIRFQTGIGTTSELHRTAVLLEQEPLELQKLQKPLESEPLEPQSKKVTTTVTAKVTATIATATSKATVIATATVKPTTATAT